VKDCRPLLSGAPTPTIRLEIIRYTEDGVIQIVEIDGAILVSVNGPREIGRWQELRHAECSGPRPLKCVRIQRAPLVDLSESFQLIGSPCYLLDRLAFNNLLHAVEFG